MSVWYCIPSCRPVKKAQPCINAWASKGYQIAVMRQGKMLDNVDLQIHICSYAGWAASVNMLAKLVLKYDMFCEWIVCGGDDYFPADLDPLVIGRECMKHFGGTLGVMQPTGDRWGSPEEPFKGHAQREGEQIAFIDRVAASPWMGREWVKRAYGGDGPLPPYYYHYHADEELQLVATKLKVFWQRQDLRQYHGHDERTTGVLSAHLKPLNTQTAWQRSLDIFEDRKRSQFPGHKLLNV